jgi:hypothetical protein
MLPFWPVLGPPGAYIFPLDHRGFEIEYSPPCTLMSYASPLTQYPKNIMSSTPHPAHRSFAVPFGKINTL